jgi:AcrR family transcriptional regulator
LPPVKKAQVESQVEREASPRRSYDNSLRQRQQEMTRDSIMVAAQELVLEGRIHNFTILEVASRAGVSHRTVYLHFESREAILEGVVHWSAAQTAGATPPYPERLEDLPVWVEQAVPSLMSFLPAAKAMDAVLNAVYGRQVPPAARERDELFARLVAKAAPGLSEVERKAATAGLRLWVSMRSLIELNARYGLDEEALTLAVSRGVRAQIDQLMRLTADAEKGSAE